MEILSLTLARARQALNTCSNYDTSVVWFFIIRRFYKKRIIEMRRISLSFFIYVSLFFVACEKEDIYGFWTSNEAYTTNISCISAKVIGKAVSPKRIKSEIVFTLEYSTSREFENAAILHISTADIKEEDTYSLLITGLSPSTTYYFRNDVWYEGEHHYGRVGEFTTKTIATLIETMPASNTSRTGALLNGTYDLTDVYYTSAQFGFKFGVSREELDNDAAADKTDVSITALLSELIPSTNYHYVAYANIDGRLFMGDTLSFSTLFNDAAILTSDATNITSLSATLNAIVEENNVQFNENVKFGFRFGDTSNHLDNEVVAAVPSNNQLSTTIQDLRPFTVYYYQPFMVIDNKEEIQGGLMSFKTDISCVHKLDISINERISGIRVHVEGYREDTDLTLTIMGSSNKADFNKEPSQIIWSHICTIREKLYRRDYYIPVAPGTTVFGAYISDRWGNCSDTTTRVLSPVEYAEAPLDKARFKNANLPDDNCKSENPKYYPIESLWDGSGLSSIPHFFVSEQSVPSPCWLTIDLGQETSLSSIETLPRIGYIIYGGGAVRDYEFWGSLNPSGVLQDVTEQNPHGFDNTWFCLGRFTQEKPTGYLDNGLPGHIYLEDSQAYNAGNHFDFNSRDFPHCYDRLRYLRVVFLDTFTTFEYPNASNRQVQTGEITPIGILYF